MSASILVLVGIIVLIAVVVYAADKHYKAEEQKQKFWASGQQGKAMENQQAEALLMEFSGTHEESQFTPDGQLVVLRW